MNQANFRLGYPPIAQWAADELPEPRAVRRTVPRPRLSEVEQARRRALDVPPPAKIAKPPAEPNRVTRAQAREAALAFRDELAKTIGMDTAIEKTKAILSGHGGRLINSNAADVKKAFEDALRDLLNDDWIEWSGGECSIRGKNCIMRFRDGTETGPEPLWASDFCWGRIGGCSFADIITYKIVP